MVIQRRRYDLVFPFAMSEYEWQRLFAETASRLGRHAQGVGVRLGLTFEEWMGTALPAIPSAMVPVRAAGAIVRRWTGRCLMVLALGAALGGFFLLRERHAPRLPERVGDLQAQPLARPVPAVPRRPGVPLRTPVSAGLVPVRLRSRALWVRRLEKLLGGGRGCVGRFLAGRWTPDLPSPDAPLDRNFLLWWIRGGARILGGGSVPGREEEAFRDDGRPWYRDGRRVRLPGPRQVFYHVELRDGSVATVFPELLAKLCAYAFCREREPSLVSALRLRALEWCKEQGFSSVLTMVALAGSLRLAFDLSEEEDLTVQTLESLGQGPTRWWGRA